MSSLVTYIRHWIHLSNPKWSEEERRNRALLRRLDLFFCTYISLSAVVKYLDQTNINNAYVSGMQVDLELNGNQLNYFTTYFNIGYIIIVPLSTYVINDRIRPSLWLPIAELLWGIGTAGLAAVQNYKQIYGLRFMIGLCEGTAWPGSMVLILSWYKPEELGLRIAIYQSATSFGGIVSGFLQSALYTNLNGHHGIAGWRWLFIVNAAITIVIALFGFIGCPDYPTRVNPWSSIWLRPQDIATAQARMAGIKRELPKGWSLKTMRNCVTRPSNIAIWLTYTILGQGGTGTGFFNLWLRSLTNADGSKRYSEIPIAANCIAIVALFVLLTASDRVGKRWPFLIFVALNGIVWAAVLTAWTVPNAAKFASFFLLNIGTAYASLSVAWMGSIISHSAEERSFIIALVVTTFYVIGAGVPLKVWPAREAPVYRIGWKYALAMYTVAIPVILITVWLEKRKNRKERLLQDETSAEAEQLPAFLDTETPGDRTPDEKSRLDEPLGDQTPNEKSLVDESTGERARTLKE